MPTAQLLQRAARERRGLGAFNVITLEYGEAIMAGAEQSRRPVILQVSENAARFHGSLRPITAALTELAAAAEVEVSLHLDHVEDEGLLHESLSAGFSSVMFDAGRLPYADNLAATTRATTWAHEHGLLIEAELGYVGGKDTQVTSAHAPGARTDPEQASEFVSATGVDALAVAVGSAHAMTSRVATLDHELIAEIHRSVDVPLVLHGSSGVAVDDLSAAVGAGITKVNVGTLLSVAFTTSVREVLRSAPELSDPRAYLAEARGKIASVVAGMLEVIDHRP
ncbi:MAG TPA: class II fructose-bisphosphate aldolase [Propionibacteriaceae bacterium]|nr:class II fructose-bisphosphate aldolase [Propionibacteriaceae bacterium]